MKPAVCIHRKALQMSHNSKSKRTMKQSTMIAVLAFIISFGSVTAQPSYNRAMLDSLFDALTTHDKSMGTIFVSKGGETVYERSIGFRTMSGDMKTPSDANTRYRIGSITKTFTAVLVMQLIEEGLLSEETTLATYYPDIPNAEKITIKHLLQHRSGLFNFTNSPEFPTYMVQGKSRDEMITMLEKSAIDFEPGSAFKYSNTGYLLLGYILEDITGTSYADLIQTRIVDEIGLENTYVGGAIDTNNAEANSFLFLEDWIPSHITDARVTAAAGAIVSTASDLALFFNALVKSVLVEKESFDRMTQFVDSYGYGLFQMPFYDHLGYGHNGSIDAFNSTMAYMPDSDLIVVYLTNGGAYPINTVLIAALSANYDQPFTQPDFTEMEISADQLGQYTGEYSTDSFPLKITILVDAGKLYGQATGQPRFPLTAKGDHTFVFDTAAITITFNPDANEMSFKQGPQQFLFKK